MRIAHETRPVSQCGDDERRACFAILSRLFLGVTWTDFARDFDAKDDVMLLRDAEDGTIGGFSTLVRRELDVGGEAVPIVFSGDTAVLPAFRASFGLGAGLSRYLAATPVLYPGRRPYYVLISKGWRTYRMLRLFFRSFFPCATAPVPASERRVRDAFAATCSGSYDPARGVQRHGPGAPRLRPQGIDAAAPADGDADAAFFLSVNPGWLSGDELVCIARVERENFTATLRRLARVPEVALTA